MAESQSARYPSFITSSLSLLFVRQGWLRVISLLIVTTLAQGCYRDATAKEHVDQATFQYLGGTIFSEPDQLTMKEIHLDNGVLVGREIIIEGAVAEVSKHFTYMVLTDSTARMMVILTGVVQARPIIEKEKPKIVRILGVVESGRMGHPIVRARSINVVKDPRAAFSTGLKPKPLDFLPQAG